MCAAPTSESIRTVKGPRVGARAQRAIAVRRRFLKGATPYLLIGPALVVVLAVMAYPLATLATLSLQHYGLRQLIAHQGDWVGLENYTGLLSDSVFWQVVFRSVAFTVTAVAASMALATLLALLLQQVSTVVRLLLSGGLVFIWVTPVVVAIDVWQWMVDYEFGVVNWLFTHLGLGNFVHHNWFENPVHGFAIITALVIWGALPFLTITLYAALAQVPRELVEAAEVDGATAWRVFWQVVTPILKPIFLILFSLSTIWDFQVFNQVWIMLNARPSSDYFLIGVYSFEESFKVAQYGRGAAIAVVMVALLMVFTFFYVREMVKTGVVDG